MENGEYVQTVYLSMKDQYGSSWESNNVAEYAADGTCLGLLYPDRVPSSGNETSGAYYRYRKILLVTGEDDQTVTYTFRLPTANSEHPSVTASFSVSYKCLHRVEIVFDGEVRDTLEGSEGTEITLDYPSLVSDGFDLEWTLEGGGLLDPVSSKYVFGSENGTLTAVLVPYSFTVAFDGNGAAKGSMASRIQRVGTAYTLPGNTYTNTGYEFTGWNTEPDGSGDAYPNKATVRDLSTVKGDTVTLYAQWKIKTYTVTFVNKLTGERIKQTVEYGQDAVAPDIAPVPAGETQHSVFSKWNKSFASVKSNITVTSVHTLEDHTFPEEGARVCTVCGYSAANPSETGSVFGGGELLAILLPVLVLGAAAVTAVVLKRKKNPESGE